MSAPTPITLEVVDRSGSHSAVAELRRAGYVPANLYGYQVEPMLIAAPAQMLEKIWHRAGKTHLIKLELPDKSHHNVLIRELQVDPRTARLFHVDFFAINPKNKLTAEVPIVLHGDAPAVTVTKVGQLLQLMTTIKVECLPSDLPAHLTADISGLDEVDKGITVADIPSPHGVTILHSPLEDIVVRVVPHRVRATEEEEAEAAESTETEVSTTEES